MGLGGKTVTTWEEMKTTFLDKYQYYCKSRDVKEEIFKIMHKENENMEDFLERFNYSLQRSGHNDIDKDILKIIFLRSLREDSLELLNMVGKGTYQSQTLTQSVNYASNVHEEQPDRGRGLELPNRPAVGSQI